MTKKVAIIGYSFRLPGTSKETFWNDLLEGKNLVTEIPSDRWPAEQYLHPDKTHPGTSYTFKAGTLGDISGFDAEFFGISSREATVVDPQQRYLLELTWEALEHAGIRPDSLKKTNTGVYLGMSSVDYAYRMADDMASINSSTATGNTGSIAANRISYTFDLRGPSFSLDTACSSSLYAFHHACQAIINGEVSTAITGSVSLLLHPFGFIAFSKATMLSPDGECRFCDETANGYVRAEGGGIFILKDYEQAVADRDLIHAVVAGTGVNIDGHKSGMTIPSWQSQANLMQQVYERAGISADQVDYLEAHGTGTPVGDPIETHSIGRALGQKRAKPLLFGSIKSNMGHLEPASGIAGLVKALHVLKYRAVPPTTSMRKPNPNIKFNEWNIELAQNMRELTPSGQLTVGINSFGFGGANAHVVLQSHEVTTANPATPPTAHLPWIVTGKTQAAVQANAQKLASALTPQTQTYDTAWHLANCKQPLEHGAVFFADTIESARAQLAALAAGQETTSTTQGSCLAHSPGPVFVYSGNGCQWEGMGAALLTESAEFCRAVEEVDELFTAIGEFSIKEELTLLNGKGRLVKTEIAQPTLFALQVGITRTLISQGIKPIAVIGHSIGEVAAAWASGALTLAQAVQVVYFRSYFQGKTQGLGGMSAANLGAVDAQALLNELQLDQVEVAGVNSYQAVTFAGNTDQLSQLEGHLATKNIFHSRLGLDYAFHSACMDSIENDIKASLAALKPGPTQVPLFSTVTGSLIAGESLTADYWWHNIRYPVAFDQAIDALIASHNNCFVEIGAHPVLRYYLKEQCSYRQVTAAVIATQSRKHGNMQELQQAIGLAILANAYDKTRYFPVEGRRQELPTNAWQPQKYWYQPSPESLQLLTRVNVHPLLGAKLPHRPLTWENRINLGKLAWLSGHNVGGSVVLPGAAFIEIALQAAAYFKPDSNIELESLEILSPLILDDATGKVVQTRISASGQLEILSRTYNADEAWRLHARAKCVHEATALELKALTLPQPPATSQLYSHDQHYQLTERAGLNYAGAFCAVRHVASFGDSYLAELQLPEGVNTKADDYYLHPGLLDSAIQLVIHHFSDLLEQVSGIAYVPISLEKISYQKQAATPTYALLTRLNTSPQSILTRVELYTADKKPLAVINNLRYRAVRLHSNKQHLTFLDYYLQPAPLTSTAIEGLPPLIITALGKSFDTNTGTQETYQQEFLPLVDSYLLLLIQEQLSELNAREPQHLQNLLQLFTEAPDALDPIVEKTIETALNANILERNENIITLLDTEYSEELTAELIWNTFIREYSDYFEENLNLGRFSKKLHNRLNDKNPSAKTDEQASSTYLKYFNAHYKRSVAKSLQNLSEVIQTVRNQLPVGSRLNICELSDKTSYLASSLLPDVQFDCMDYVFTSSATSSLQTFEDTFHKYPLAITHLLGAEPPASISGKSQLALVNVDHDDLGSLATQLQQLKPLLCSDASILLCGLSQQAWQDLVFSQAPTDFNPDHCEQLLRELGFTDIQSITTERDIQDHFILLAQWLNTPTDDHSAEAEDTPSASGQTVLLLADSSAATQPVTEALKARTPAAHIEQIALAMLSERLRYAATAAEFPVQIIYTPPATAVHSIDTLAAGCAELAELHRLLIENKQAADVIVVTRGVMTMFDTQLTSNPDQSLPGDAAIWGFARTLMNETTGYKLRLIDLPAEPSRVVLRDFSREISTPGHETEVFYSQTGARYVPRLRMESQPFRNTTAPAQRQNTTLMFDLPGQLKNLGWRQHSLPTLADNQVEVCVKATGLNFRDVMYALGLLADEALENGFAGASLGLEFSGEVSAVGNHVSQFQVGDRVVGFNSSCFSDRIICSPDTLLKIPQGLSYPSATTIPTTFLTVYYALKHLARLQPGERVLIHGAAGGVGLAAIQVAQWLGAEIFATVGAEEKRDYVSLLGVKNIYSSRDLTFADRILHDTEDKPGVDVVLNSLAGEAINQNLKVLRPFGRFLELGKRDFYENTPIGLKPFRNNISYFGIDADQLQKELPQLARQLFEEVMQGFNEGSFFPLPYTEFSAYEAVGAFRYIQQAKQIGKVVVTYPDNHPLKSTAKNPLPESPHAALTLKDSGVYLVTGGLGGFGLATAKWLISKGAKKLLLLSRRGAGSEEAQEFLREAVTNNIQVKAISCDVTDLNQVVQAYKQAGEELGPIKGIIHAATVIEDDLAINLDVHKIDSGMRAKMAGALNLHQASLNSTLDFFVMYSSVTTLWGNPGQASYVAANHWLEAFTAHRRQLGLPATCIRWGAIEDTGFLQRNEQVKSALTKRTGSQATRAVEALAILEKALVSNRPTIGVMELNWGRLKRNLVSAQHPKFNEISRLDDSSDEEQDSGLDLKAMLKEMGIEKFKGFILAKVRHELAQILMIPEEKIDLDKSIYDMGMDSLMGLELVTGLEAKLGIQIPVMALSETPRLNALSDKIIQLIQQDDSQSTEEEALFTSVKNLATVHSQEVEEDQLREFSQTLKKS